MTAVLGKSDLRWGLTHGDFHKGQIMYRDEDQDFLFLDWEFSGIFGNPSIDIARWISKLSPQRMANDNQYLEAYWNALI